MASKPLPDRAERALAAAPGDPDALISAMNVRAACGDVGGALELLKRHGAARSAVRPEILEKTLRAMAAADPVRAVECHWALAREQLRSGDIEGARRTLEALPEGPAPAEVGRRLSELRASALFRGGDSAAALKEVQRVSERDTSVSLSLAEFAVAKGELTQARRSLFLLEEATRASAHLEARRTLALAMSYLFEERYARAARWARKARIQMQRQEPLLVMIEVLSELGLDQIDRAAALAERTRVASEEGIGLLLRAATMWRRGAFEPCFTASEPGLKRLDEHSDRVARGVVARYLGRAAIGLGALDRAEELFRQTSALAAEPGTALLAGIAAMDRSALAEARGDRAAARREALRAKKRLPRSPFARIEAWALAERDAPEPKIPPSERTDAVLACVALRGAERALERNDLDRAAEDARRAERWYRSAGARYELARALLAHAEADVRRDRRDDGGALSELEAICAAEKYAHLSISASLIRAAIADRSGDAATLQAALQFAGSDRARPFAARIERLGLARARTVQVQIGSKIFLRTADDPPIAADLTVDLVTGKAQAKDRIAELSPRALALLEALASGEPITLEKLYLSAWGGSEYHPLRHRNTLYVAINRLRGSLEPLIGDAIVQASESTYRIAPGLAIALRKTL